MTYEKQLQQYLGYLEGFFIEAGAHNGFFQSNTKFLEKKWNWRGLLIEPCLSHYRTCLRIRKRSIVERAALVSPDYPHEYIQGDFDGHPCGSIHGSKMLRTDDLKTVPATTLSTLLDRHRIEKVDFLSLDIEGFEYEALQGLNFARHSPKFILVEIYPFSYNPIFSLLQKNGYHFVENISTSDRNPNPPKTGWHHDYLFNY